jgi:hypothetical protein
VAAAPRSLLQRLSIRRISIQHQSLIWSFILLLLTSNRYRATNNLTSHSKCFPLWKSPVPSGTNAIYLTALSLSDQPSTVSVSWTDGSATYGADFEGPSETYVLGDRVFGQPIIAVAPVPSEVSVSFNFEDTITSQHSVSEPITKKVGPAGNATSNQISGYAADDHHHHKPTTITMVFQGSLRGLSAQS